MSKKQAKVNYIGDYQLTGLKLGTGSYSTVYEAIHKTSHKKYALKVINTEQDNYIKHHHKKEAYLLAKLKHENIIKMIEFADIYQHFVIVLEIFPENMCDYIRHQKRGKIDETVARIIFRQMISAVAYVHEKDIIHRDVKLENLLIDPKTYKIKLTDFGLSIEWNRQTLLTTICGSAEYSSPELHKGIPYGNEIDVWALGVVLFAMVVGRLPFDVESKKPVNSKHRHELFLVETKRGVKTVRHQNLMSSTSPSFKDLTSKLLNPSQQLRVKLKDAEKHDWIVLNKIEIGRMKSSSNHSHQTNATPCGSKVNTQKPGTAQICDSVRRAFMRPITQAEKSQNLRTNQTRFNKVK